MDFYKVVDDVLELLRGRGRVTYRALKVQFQLADEQLEALKEEVIYAQQVARDEENRVLVWVGGTQEAASPPDQTPQQPTIQETLPTHEPPLVSRSPEAERRQLTVMFCDLVDSTKLSSQLDPEDYRDVVRAYQSVCTEVIQRYDGHIAQLLGDGLLVYFGYPVAHEEDGQRAIHTGLGILKAIRTLNTRLEPDKGIRLAVRLGIHTGLVVVGEMGGAGRQEQLALGETPNVASRIQGIAEADTLVISSSTYHLIQGYFECQALGEQTLRGISQPISIYQVLQESGVQSRLDVASTRGLTPLVGREQEVRLLMERWEQAKEGQGQVILLSGEAGIGKSRLAQVLKDHLADEPHTRWECRSSPYYQNTALHPIIDLVQRTLQYQQDDSPAVKLEKLELALSQYRLPLEESVQLFALLLSLQVPEDRYPPLTLSPQRQRQKTLESIVAILLELVERQPLLFILEDLHWTDPTTLELLGLLVEQVPAAAIFTLLTCRPHFQPAWHHRSYLTEITVNRLSRHHIEGMAERVAGGKKLPAKVIQQIVEKTDGVPLFVEEMTKAIVESGALKEREGQYDLTGAVLSLSIPATLQDSLMSRLDRLVTAKAVAQYAAVIGRQFSYALLQAVSELDEMTLQRELGRLVEAELIYQRGLPPQATYFFKHALVVDAAYQSLLKSTRQQYHQRIAQVLEERFPKTLETQPELLAHHYSEAGLVEPAIRYWQQAGERAIERSANVEAIMHLNKGLELLKVLPGTPERTQQELGLLIPLGLALIATKGFAALDVEQTYRQAHTLCQQLGDTPQLFRVLNGLWVYSLVRGEIQIAEDLAEQLFTLAQHQRDPVLLTVANVEVGETRFWHGALLQARAPLEHATTLYMLHSHSFEAFLRENNDPGVIALAFATWVLWLRGYPEQALQQSHAMLALGYKVSHLPSFAHALVHAATLHQFRRELQAMQERVEAYLTLAAEQGFAQWVAVGTLNQGWLLAAQGQSEEGITQMHQGITAYRATGAELDVPHSLALLAETYGRVGQPEKGLTILIEALAVVDKNDERWYEAELHRLQGELLLPLSPDNHTEAASCFQKALKVARSQQAKSLELRAATSLAKLWQSQGKRQDAYNLLAPVYGWFTEGFDTADLKDAKALLDELR
jgi:class 3 adenylate cyclase/predicted ATPase